MPAQARRLVLAVHVTASVGWIGSVVAFLALAVAGIASADSVVVTSVYVAMSVVGWWVIVPFSLVSALSGLIQSIGTSWGLFRHYWVAIKIAMTLPSIGLLFLHMGPADMLAATAREAPLAGATTALQTQLVIDAAAAVVVLVVATILSIYKPRGVTPLEARRISASTASDELATRRVAP